MWTAIIAIILVLLFVVGGMMTLLKNKGFKLPDNYDKTKSGFDDDDDESSGY